MIYYSDPSRTLTLGNLVINIVEENQARMRPLPSSFRDPSGFLFSHGSNVYRQVNEVYKSRYEQLFESGLYQSLCDKGWLVSHEEVPHPGAEEDAANGYKVLLPEQIPYISYPYEWCFSQLKDAALLTLEIQQEALRHGMTLKDASAYNVQFLRGKPIFIDTLSFDIYQQGDPWIAYRQFCQHFLAPLALIAKCDFRLLHLLRAYIDGIPLDLTSRLLPIKSWFNYSLLAHIHLHARTQRQFEDSGRDRGKNKIEISKLRLEGVVSSLLSAVQRLECPYSETEWGNYYADTNYVDVSMQHKEEIVSAMLAEHAVPDGAIAADFGANTGKFSRLAAKAGYYVLSHDIDEVAVDKNYRKTREQGENSILPLLLDLTNPSPGLGWGNVERSSFIGRRKVEVGMALALIHHVAISNNVPLQAAAALFAELCRFLIIEFVPKNDSQVQRLLATREDIFPHYHRDGFETAFKQHFDIVQSVSIRETTRTLYFMQAKV